MTPQYNDKLTEEQLREIQLEKIAQLRPIDDIFMRVLFRNNIPLAQYVLRIITGIGDLFVIKEETQYDLERLVGVRSVCLDVMAEDSAGRKFNLEVQKPDNGASPKRARYHSSAMDVEYLSASEDFDSLPITYVIFITENDVLGKGWPIYTIDRMITNGEQPFGFNDDQHIIYVNCAYRNEDDSSDLAKLIHDFCCNKADEMYLKILADETHLCKEIQKGEIEMCDVMEEYMEIVRRDDKIGTAIVLLQMDKLTHEEISKASGLPLDLIKELSKKYKPVSV